MSPTPPPRSGTGRPPTPGWPRVAIRMFLLLVLGQVAGTAIGVLVVAAVLGADAGDAGWVIDAVTGAVAGLVLGLLVRPAGDRFPGLVGLSAVVGAVTLLILLVAGRSRGAAGAPVDVGALVLGSLLALVLQIVVAGAVWLLRLRRAARA